MSTPTVTDVTTASPPDQAASPSPRRGPRRRELAIAAAILLAVVVAVAMPFWPGRMNADTLNEISQVITGHYTDQHAPLLQALWHLVYSHGVGPGWILAGQSAVFVVGVALVMRTWFSIVGSAVATAVVSFVPPVYGYLGLVGRDAWFAAALMLSFGCIARLAGSEGRRRWWWIAGAVLAGWVALAARQNAGAGCVVAFALLAGLLAPSPAGWTKRRLAAIAGVGLAITIGLFATQVVIKQTLDITPANPEAQLYIYDLAALSVQDGRSYLPRSAMPDPSLANVDAHFSTDTMLPFISGPAAAIAYPISNETREVLGEAWRKRVLADPLGYLQVRAELYVRQIALTRPAEQTYHPFIDGNPFGYSTTVPAANEVASDYLDAFADDQYRGGVLYRVWIYLLVAAGVAIVFLRRRQFPALLLGALALTALTYQAGIVLGAMAVGYRLEYPAVVLTIVAMVALVGMSLRALRARRAAPR